MFSQVPSVSNSRTYVIAIYEIGAPNEVTFKKVKLPESIKNNSNVARNQFLLNSSDPVIRVMACVPLEHYMASINDTLVEEIILDTPAVSSGILTKDMEAIRAMLDKWNESHFPGPGNSYAITMSIILEQNDFLQTQNKMLIEDMKGLKEFLKNFNNKY
jgi:hypothetical protein